MTAAWHFRGLKEGWVDEVGLEGYRDGRGRLNLMIC